MVSRLRQVIAGVDGLVLGGAVAFFGIGPVLFADGGLGERVWAAVAVLAVYAALGCVLGALSPTTWKWSGGLTVIPVLPVIVLFGDDAFSSVETGLLAAVVLVGSVATGLSGALAGSLLMGRIRRS